MTCGTLIVDKPNRPNLSQFQAVLLTKYFPGAFETVLRILFGALERVLPGCHCNEVKGMFCLPIPLFVPEASIAPGNVFAEV